MNNNPLESVEIDWCGATTTATYDGNYEEIDAFEKLGYFFFYELNDPGERRV